MNPRSGCRDSQCDGFTAAVRRHQFLAGNDFPVAVEAGLCRQSSRFGWQLAGVIGKPRSRPSAVIHGAMPDDSRRLGSSHLHGHAERSNDRTGALDRDGIGMDPAPPSKGESERQGSGLGLDPCQSRASTATTCPSRDPRFRPLIPLRCLTAT